VKRKHKETLESLYESGEIARPKDPPKRGILEEIGNAVTHGVGSVFAIVAFLLMLIAADTPREYVGASIYFFGLFVMFTMSCLYHAFSHGSAVKRLFRRFDYSSIYLLIGATFAPPLLCVVGGTFGIVFFIIQWAVIAAGISLVGVFGPTKLRFVHIPMYVILGWSALMLLPSMIATSFPLAMWILAGGVVYTLGIIPFTMKTKVSHFIWHFFVLAGAVVQGVGIYLYIYLA
jgi:hemolysin III